MPNIDMSGASFATIQSLRTGSVVIDMAVAMLIPLAFRFLFDGGLRKLLEELASFCHTRFYKRTRPASVRTLTHVILNNHNGWTLGDVKNDALQKALVLYLGHIGVRYEQRAQVALQSLQDARTVAMNHGRDKYNPLESFRLTWLAPENEWVNVGNGVSFRQIKVDNPGEGNNENGGNASSNKKEKMVYELKSFEGAEKIDELIEKALAWYKQELLSMRDESRYLYSLVNAELSAFGSSDKKGEDGLKYKRYALSDHKTFDSLFFPGKEDFLALLSDFRECTGKFGVPGFPHKLGVMLHGPPGTGKTSLIKALAHATGRSIITIPLAQIKTNQMLFDIMYDLKLKVDGVDQPPLLNFKDVIFVIEDIDAASKVVHRRDGKGKRPSAAKPDEAQESMMEGAAKAVGDTALASLIAARRACGPMQAPSESAAGGGGASDNSQAEEGPNRPSMAELMGDLLQPKPDALNLAGVLNVLDGVVDTPGRLVIMTSNHPEVLDPALIRPGRIDRQIYLGHLQPKEAAEMLAHYFGKGVDAAQREKLTCILRESAASAPVTPAALEQLCARFRTIDELLDEMQQDTGRSASPTAGAADGIMPEAGYPPAPSGAPLKAVAHGELETLQLKRQVSGG